MSDYYYVEMIEEEAQPILLDVKAKAVPTS